MGSERVRTGIKDGEFWGKSGPNFGKILIDFRTIFEENWDMFSRNLD